MQSGGLKKLLAVSKFMLAVHGVVCRVVKTDNYEYFVPALSDAEMLS